MLRQRYNEGSCFVGRIDCPRVPAIHCLLNKPELASLGPACIHQAIYDRAPLATTAQDRCKIGPDQIIRLATKSLDDATMAAL